MSVQSLLANYFSVAFGPGLLIRMTRLPVH